MDGARSVGPVAGRRRGVSLAAGWRQLIEPLASKGEDRSQVSNRSPPPPHSIFRYSRRGHFRLAVVITPARWKNTSF